MDGLGEGLAALGFWGFVAAMIVAGIWNGARKREAEHETLRRLIESGKPVDPELMGRVLGRDGRPDRNLRIAGIVLMWAAPGVALLALFMLAGGMWMPTMVLLGAAALIFCVGFGLKAASTWLRRSQAEEAAGTEAH